MEGLSMTTEQFEKMSPHWIKRTIQIELVSSSGETFAGPRLKGVSRNDMVLEYSCGTWWFPRNLMITHLNWVDPKDYSVFHRTRLDPGVKGGAGDHFTLQGSLVGGENILRFFEPNHFDIGAHEAEGLGKVPHVLVLRMERADAADAGSNNHFGPIAAVGHEMEFVEMIHDLVDGEQQKVPAWEDAHRHVPGESQSARHSHLQFLCDRQFQ